MSEDIGRRSIDRAIASLTPKGTLELSFFGGEPLLEASLVDSLVNYARKQTNATGTRLDLSITTNGTVTTAQAWSIMLMPDLDLAISFDGQPAIHDRHRLSSNGNGSAKTVLFTMHRLHDAGKAFQVIMVVRPDTVGSLPDSIEFLRNLGINAIHPSLDIWTMWTEKDMCNMEEAVSRSARVWRRQLPDLSISCFDEKAAQLACVPATATARCGFGDGEIAVAASGRLYPCERLIGEDTENSATALPGHVLDGDDFLCLKAPPERADEACNECAMLFMCSTDCRCSNYVRTGDITKADQLLCVWNQACLNETAAVLNEPALQNAE